MVKIYIDSVILFKFQMLVVCNVTNKQLVLFLFTPNGVRFFLLFFFFYNIWQEPEEEHKNKTKENKNLFVVTFLISVKIINKVLKMIC